MESDDDLEIELLNIEAKLRSGGKGRGKECYSELFDWLVERSFNQNLPATRDECHKLLADDIPHTIYEIVLSKNWVRQVQTRPYTMHSEYLFGDEARRKNALNHDVFRLLTAEEMANAYLAHRIPHWEAEFLRRRKALAQSVSSAVPLIPTASNKVGGRGPKPTIPHQTIAKVVEKHGSAWTTESALALICDELKQLQIALPANWAKWRRKPRSWPRALDYRRDLVVKHLEYCLQMARRK